MTRTSLKQRRQELDLTQAEVAKALGVSQPTYQNYETGAKPIPGAKLKRLAKVLRMTTEEILGKSKEITEDRSRAEVMEHLPWGEVTMHFAHGAPLVLTISYGEYRRLFRQLQDDGAFFHVFSMSNQMVAVRRAAVTDAYLADDGSNTFGPEHDSYVPGHAWFSEEERFWEIADDLTREALSLEEIEEKYGRDAVTNVARDIGLNMPQDIDRLISEGLVAATDRESVLAEAAQILADTTRLALDISWQLSDGKVRRTAASRDNDMTQYWWIDDAEDPDNQGPMIIVDVEDAQTAFINPNQLDYISIPEHRYQAAVAAEEEPEEEMAT
jgi:transcriptional regulator with XRE-family HTH domain